jgi:deazaflavin-dependent oxidoreductase (nitroreductase family)
MPSQGYGRWHALAQRIAASAPISWVLAHALRHLDRFVLWASGRHATLSNLLTGLPVVIVTTTGARSGRARTTPLTPIRDPVQPDRLALIASSFGQQHFPSWYYNLKKNPQALVSANGRSETYTAHEAAGDEYERFWGYAVETYLGYALYRQRAGRRIPVMVMEKESPRPAMR